MPQREAICDNLDAPVINDGHIGVHVAYDYDLRATAGGTSLPANASDGVLKRKRARVIPKR